jgi:YD repeat-containing protein
VPNTIRAIATTTMQYDNDGQLRTRTLDPNGLAIRATYEYDTLGRVTKTVSCGSCSGAGTVEYQYDDRGNRTLVRSGAVSDPPTYFDYDKLSRLVTIRAPAGEGVTATTAFEYDPWGNRTRVTDPMTKVTGFLYDKEDRLTKVTDALSGETEYAYDLWDNLTKVIDAKDHATEYEYDVRGRLTREVAPYADLPTGRFGREYLYAQTMGPILTKLRTPNQWTGSEVQFLDLTYKYDQMNRVTRMEVTKVPGPGTEFGMYCGYDINSQMVWGADEAYGTYLNGSKTDVASVWNFEYDADGRLTKERLNGQDSVTQTLYPLGERKVEFDKAGRRTKQAFKSESERTGYLALDTATTYTYDSTKHWLNGIQRQGSAADRKQGPGWRNLTSGGSTQIPGG